VIFTGLGKNCVYAKKTDMGLIAELLIPDFGRFGIGFALT
jgi:hypothetical protein